MTAVWSIDLPDSQKIVLLALADCANDEGGCWPSMATLAKKCSKGERTVQGVIKQLVEAGHLSRKEIPGKGCQYTVHPRRDCTPAETAPRSEVRVPPQGLRDTPAAAADKPSKNHQEPSIDSSSDDERVTVEDVVEGWNTTAAACGLPKVAKLTAERRRKVQARIRDFPDPDDWRTAFRHIRSTPFLLGENDRGWRASFKFLLQPESFASLVEETYGKAN